MLRRSLICLQKNINNNAARTGGFFYGMSTVINIAILCIKCRKTLKKIT